MYKDLPIHLVYFLITRRYRVGKNGPLSEDTEPTAYIFILCRVR